ncbi:MAG: hypothetical protein ACPGKR_05435, partial [Poseidonia sp.]
MEVSWYEGSLKKSEDCRFPEENGLDVSKNGDEIEHSLGHNPSSRRTQHDGYGEVSNQCTINGIYGAQEVSSMWTDEQLLEQGWTQPQIDQWRSEQQPPVADIPAVHEPAMSLPAPEPTTSVATPEPSIPIAETKPGSLSGVSAGFSSDKTQLIL